MVKLNNLKILIDSTDFETSLSYSFGENKISETTYGIIYLLNSSENAYGYLTPGDLAQLELIIPTGIEITEESRLVIRVVPLNGIVKTIDITLPAQLSSKRITLY